MLYILKISLVTYIFILNSLKCATKAISLASFKEIQWQIIQWLARGWWFFAGTPVSPINKTDRHDIAEILLKVALSTITLTLQFENKESRAEIKLTD
jgi:hypothetical protein